MSIVNIHRTAEFVCTTTHLCYPLCTQIHVGGPASTSKKEGLSKKNKWRTKTARPQSPRWQWKHRMTRHTMAGNPIPAPPGGLNHLFSSDGISSQFKNPTELLRSPYPLNTTTTPALAFGPRLKGWGKGQRINGDHSHRAVCECTPVCCGMELCT